MRMRASISAHARLCWGLRACLPSSLCASLRTFQLRNLGLNPADAGFSILAMGPGRIPCAQDEPAQVVNAGMSDPGACCTASLQTEPPCIQPLEGRRYADSRPAAGPACRIPRRLPCAASAGRARVQHPLRVTNLPKERVTPEAQRTHGRRDAWTSFILLEPSDGSL
ncbi:clathrin heavy chain 2 [Eschrichtius robustus]|uniref:clathrin heavy chain 2 n=1 Tax=Eschrichtius robustus TaxID=9764 RepID=UPI0035C05C88